MFQKEGSLADTLIQPPETCFGHLTNRTVKESICVVSSHEGGGDLSQQPQNLAQVTGNGEAPGRLHAECPRCGGEFRHKYTPKPEHRRVLEMGYLKPVP